MQYLHTNTRTRCKTDDIRNFWHCRTTTLQFFNND